MWGERVKIGLQVSGWPVRLFVDRRSCASIGPTMGIAGCSDQNIGYSAETKGNSQYPHQNPGSRWNRLGVLAFPKGAHHVPCRNGRRHHCPTLAVGQTFSISIFSCPHQLSSHNSSSPQHLIICLLTRNYSQLSVTLFLP